MKITAIEAICLALPMKPLDPPSPWTAATRKQIVVRVKTDTGPGSNTWWISCIAGR
jgi:hypothetical protein